MPTLTIALLALTSLAAGTVDAIAGGGGLLTVPALMAAGLPPHLVLATNKGQAVWGSGSAMIAFWRAGRVDRRQAVYAFPLAAIGSLAGTRLVLAISPAALPPIVIALLIGAAVLMFVRPPVREVDVDARAWAAGALALAIGAYDGFFGPGTGTFLIVGFVALCGRSLVHASADAKVVNFASNLAAVVLFAHSGKIVWELALPMALGQVCGGVIGAHLTLRGGARIVRVMVVLVSGALIVKLGVDLLRAP